MLAIDNKYNIGEGVVTLRSAQLFAIGLKDDIPVHTVDRITISEDGKLTYTVRCGRYLEDDLIREKDIKDAVFNLLNGRLYQLCKQWGVKKIW